jgi:hypothetical protein
VEQPTKVSRNIEKRMSFFTAASSIMAKVRLHPLIHTSVPATSAQDVEQKETEPKLRRGI